MKKINLIYIFVFLLGMVFTVLQYIPILEEETPANTVELLKKNKKEDISDEDDSADEDAADDDALDMLNHSNRRSSFHFSTQLGFITKNKIYNLFVNNIKSPPPKV